MSRPAVEIAVREVFGRLRAYPVNEHAKTFAALIGVKTLTSEHLQLIQKLGFEIAYRVQTMDFDNTVI